MVNDITTTDIFDSELTEEDIQKQKRYWSDDTTLEELDLKEKKDEVAEDKGFLGDWNWRNLEGSIWNELLEPALEQVPGVDTFTDWLYKSPSDDFSTVNIADDFGPLTSDEDQLAAPSDKWSRASDLARFGIQTAGYWGDFWKDVGMLPINLATGQDNPFGRILDKPTWAEKIGYESDWGDVLESEGMKTVQDFSQWAGPGMLAKTGITGIPYLLKAGKYAMGAENAARMKKILSPFYPITSKGFKKGIYPLLRNTAIGTFIGEIVRENQKRKSLFDKDRTQRWSDIRTGGANLIKRGGDYLSNLMEGRGQAGAAELPSVDRGHAAGQMPIPRPRKVIPRHPREMMEMANRRGSPQEGWGMSVEFPNTGQISDRYALD